MRLTPARPTPPLALLPALALAAASLAGCDDASGPAGAYRVPDGCNPLAADWHCSLPFPSDVFRDPETGEIEMEGEAGAARDDGKLVNLYRFGAEDGFSPGTQIVAYFPFAVDDSEFVGVYDELGDWSARVSPSVIVDAANGEPVPHFIELDRRAVNAAKQALILRPLVPLTPGHRYVVALSGLKDTDGEPLPAAEGFRRLRDKLAARSPALEKLRKHFEASVFPVLESVEGLAREDLQLAWDFTVRSTETRGATATMEAIRAQIAAAFADTPPEVEITKVDDFETGDLLRRVQGTVRVPLYLDSDEPGARLLTQDPETIAAEGFADVPFVAIIPRSVLEDDAVVPARLVQYGHGIFGSRTEISAAESWVPAFANEYRLVVMAVDWWGMSSSDVTRITADLANRPDETLAFTDRVHQAMANQLALAEAMTRAMPELEAFQYEGNDVYEPGDLYYYGNSLGHIFGATYLALSSRIERAALGVGAANFSHFIARSKSFDIFFLALDSAYASPVDVQLFLTMSQAGFDRVDPMNYAPSVYDPFGGSAPKQLLVQMGVGDATVPNVGTAFFARTFEVPLLKGAAATFPLTESVEAEDAESAVAVYGYGVDPLPGLIAEPPMENGVHDAVRQQPEAQAQIDAFLRTDGAIEWFCEPPCTFELPEEE